MAAYGYLALVLACEGQVEQALATADKARELDPLSAFSQYLAGFTYCVSGRFDLGERTSRRVLELQPDSDVEAIRASLKACQADATPLMTVKVTSGPFLPAYRTDAEIARLMDTLQGGQ